MAGEYRFDSAAEYGLAQLAQVVTESFRGYPLPVYESAPRLARLVRVQSLDLSHSLVIRAPNGEFAGIGFVGLRSTRAWVSAFGVTPPHRGRGLAQMLIQRVLDQARAAGAGDVRLEVLVNNPVACHVYTKAGFSTTRELVSVERRTRLAAHAAVRTRR